jgi:hypothetical protein
MSLYWISRELWGKPRHHTVLRALQADVVITPSFAGCGTFLFLLGLCCLDVPLNFGVAGLDEGEPACHIGQAAFASDAIRNFVCPEGSPYVFSPGFNWYRSR